MSEGEERKKRKRKEKRRHIDQKTVDLRGRKKDIEEKQRK